MQTVERKYFFPATTTNQNIIHMPGFVDDARIPVDQSLTAYDHFSPVLADRQKQKDHYFVTNQSN